MIRSFMFGLLKLFFAFKKRKLAFEHKKILLIRSGAIGDVIMTTPLLRSVKENYPDASVHYLTGNWSKKVLDNNPHVDKVIAFDDKIIVENQLNGLRKLISKLKKEKYDLCIILDKHFLWNLVGFLIKPKFRVGFDRAGEGFCNNISVTYTASKYELDYYLDIAKKLRLKIKSRKPELFADKKDISAVDRLVKGKDFVVIAPAGAKNPGQELASKRYPKEKFMVLIEQIAEKTKVVLVGGKVDKEITGWIYDKCRDNKNIIDTTGKISIQQTSYLISKAKLFITNDSGALHIGSTTKTKIVAIFGPTSPKRFAPDGAIVIKSPKIKPSYDMYGRIREPLEDYYVDVSPSYILKRTKILI